jgi:kynurenine formamidase
MRVSSLNRSSLLIGAAVIIAAFVQKGCREAPATITEAPLDLSSFEVVDLSHSFDGQTLYWPTSEVGFELTELAWGINEQGYFYASNSFCSPEHGGTHIDAPIHFAEGGRTLDQIPVSQLIAPAVVIDVSQAAAENPDYLLTVADVEAWEQANGRIPEGAAVLLRTGWDRFWPRAIDYLGDDTPGDATRLHFPSYGEESARLLVEDRSVGVLGVDTASIDYGQSKDFMVHRVANGAGVPGLENVSRLDQLPPTGAWLVALPMKIAGGSGGPVRIVALLPAD